MRERLFVIVVAGFIASGCASWFMNGGRLAGAGESVAGATAVLDVPSCTDANGGAIAGPANTRYYLLSGQTGPELFERSADGSGAVITNRWQAQDGMHFFAWVQSSGWEYVLPQPGAPGVRYVYSGMRVVRAPDGSHRPEGPRIATCPLVPGT